MLAPYQPDDQVGKFEGGARLLEHGADKGAQDNDDADACEGPGKATADDARYLSERNPRQQRQHQRNSQDGQERMHLEL